MVQLLQLRLALSALTGCPSFGLKVTNLPSHCGTLYSNPLGYSNSPAGYFGPLKLCMSIMETVRFEDIKCVFIVFDTLSRLKVLFTLLFLIYYLVFW